MVEIERNKEFVLNNLINKRNEDNDEFETMNNLHFRKFIDHYNDDECGVYRYNIHKLDDGGIEITLNEGARGVIKLSDDSRTKFVHDFVFSELFGSTDVKLRVLGNLTAEYDNQSPDVVYKNEVNWTNALILEFTTNGSNREATVMDAFNRKKETYWSNLNERSAPGKDIYYGVILVGNLGVYDNVDLINLIGQDGMCRLKSLYLTALDINIALMNDGWAYIQDEDELEIERKARKAFEGIDFDWENSIRFGYTKNHYDKWMSGYSSKDKKFVKDLISEKTKVTSEAINDEIMNRDKIKEHQRNLVEKYIYESCKGERRNENNMKTIVNVPLIIPKTFNLLTEEISCGIIRDNLILGEFNVMKNIWYKAMTERLNDKNFKEEDVDDQLDDENIIEKFEALSVKNNLKRSRNRLMMNLNYEEERYIADNGVMAKKFKDEQSLKMSRANKKLPFSLRSNTQDIEDFVLRDDRLFEEASNLTINEETLIRRSLDLYDDDEATNRIMNIKQNFSKSKLGTFCRLISNIGIEITLSLKQFTKEKEFIFKKMKHFNIYLLIKCTTPSKPIFFSILYLKSENESLRWSNDTVFRRYYEDNNVFISDFVSLDKARVLNWARCHSSLMNLSCFWNEFYQTDMIVSGDIFKDGRVRRMIKISLMIHLEDKSETEETFSQYRYIAMKCFCTKPFVNKSAEMLEKLTVIPRSRLNVWALNKIIKEVRRVQEINGYKRIETGEYAEMMNPYTGDRLESVGQLLNLFYIGYSRNKQKYSENNAIGKLFKKILDKEDLYVENEETFGNNMELNSEKEHRWSISFIRSMIEEGKLFLKERVGENWDKTLESDILKRVGRINLEELCTLKASSAFKGENTKYKKVPYRRYKALEAVKYLINNENLESKNVNACDLMGRCLKDICDRGFMCIDIFEKLQYSGIREIYVMGIRERVCQVVIEAIAWVICSKFPGETMTNPDNKSEVILKHGKLSKTRFKNPVTMATSDDAAKWNQVHSVTKFCMILMNFTPKYMHPFIFRTCQLWQRRRVMINPDIINLFDKYDNLITGDNLFNRMFNAYKGLSREKWLKQGNTFVEVSGGFMQGILHYTSSLVHILYLEWLKRLILRLNKTFKELLIDYVASSDDSCMLISANCNSGLDELKFRFYTWKVFRLKREFGFHAGIIESVKSTKNTKEFAEFNSQFYVGPNHIVPTIKSVIACNVITQFETLVGFQESINTLVTDIIMNGGGNFLASVCEVSCCIQYYNLLGNYISPYFSRMVGKWVEFPDNSLGFFVLSHPKSVMFGYQLSLYNLLIKTNVGCKYIDLISNSYAQDDESLVTTAKGSLTRQYLTTWGNRERIKFLVQRLNLPSNWINVYDDEPIKLFEKPRTINDVILSMAFKISSPGVSESLASTMGGPNMITASVYMLVFNIFSQQSTFIEPVNDGEGVMKIPDYSKEKKVSLLKLMSDESLRYNAYPSPSEADREKLRTYFDNSENFDRILNDLDSIKGSKLVLNSKERVGRSTIEVYSLEEKVLNNAYKLCARKWFDKGFFKGSTTYFNYKWDELKSRIKWLDDNSDETLRKSPFKHWVQLSNFLARIGEKERKIKVSGVPIKTKSSNNYITFIEKNAFGNYSYQMKGKESSKESIEDNKLTMHYFKRLIESPLEDVLRFKILIKLIKKRGDEFSLNKIGSRKNELAIMKYCLDNGKYSLENVINVNNNGYDRNVCKLVVKIDDKIGEKFKSMIYHNNKGIFGKWVISQMYNEKTKEYYGNGTWVGKITGYKVRIRVTDNTMTSIEINDNIRNWFEFGLSLNEWLKVMNIKNERKDYLEERDDVMRFLNSKRVNRSKMGAKIILGVRELNAANFKDVEINSVMLEARGNRMLLKAKVKDEKNYSTVCSVGTRPNDIMEGFIQNIDIGFPDDSVEKFMYKYIRDNETLSLEEVVEVIQYSEMYFNRKVFRKLINRFFYQSCWRYNIYKTVYGMSTKESEERKLEDVMKFSLMDDLLDQEMEETENYFNRFLENADFDKVNEELESGISLSEDLMDKLVEDINNEIYDDYDKYNYGSSDIEVRSFEMFSKSNLMDGVVKELLTYMNVNEVKKLINEEPIGKLNNDDFKYAVESLMNFIEVKLNYADSDNNFKFKNKNLNKGRKELEKSSLDWGEEMNKLENVEKEEIEVITKRDDSGNVISLIENGIVVNEEDVKRRKNNFIYNVKFRKELDELEKLNKNFYDKIKENENIEEYYEGLIDENESLIDYINDQDTFKMGVDAAIINLKMMLKEIEEGLIEY